MARASKGRCTNRATASKGFISTCKLKSYIAACVDSARNEKCIIFKKYSVPLTRKSVAYAFCTDPCFNTHLCFDAYFCFSTYTTFICAGQLE